MERQPKWMSLHGRKASTSAAFTLSVSGAGLDGPELLQMVQHLEPGDVVVAERITGPAAGRCQKQNYCSNHPRQTRLAVALRHASHIIGKTAHLTGWRGSAMKIAYQPSSWQDDRMQSMRLP